MFKHVVKEQLKVPAHIDYLGDLRDFVTKIGKKYGFSDRVINAFKLAVDEASTNIIHHAYRDKPGLITIRAIVKKNSMTVVLLDQGRYFDPRQVKEPDLKSYIKIGKKGGLGIFMIRRLMDDIEYRKTEEGNELRLTKKRDEPRKRRVPITVPEIGLSIKAKFYLVTSGIITVAVATAYFYQFSRVDDRIRSDAFSTIRQISRTLADASGLREELAKDLPSDLVVTGAIDAFQRKNQDILHRVFIVDLDNTIYSTSEDLFSQFQLPPKARKIGEEAFLYKLPSGIEVYDVLTPILRPGETRTGKVGEIHVQILRSSVNARISAQRFKDLRLALLILLCAYVGTGILLTLVLTPFRRLADWVRALGHGDVEDEIDIDESTEIGEIAKAFSEITAKFRESQANLAEQERLQREMQVAQEIQQTLLPMEFPEVEGFEIESFYEAAREVGGDYFDFVEVDKDTLGIVVADVSGKGVPGSLVMTMIRTALRTEARGVHSASEVLAKVNDFVVPDMKKGMFVTLFYVIIDSKRRRVTYASAGHNPMILYRGSTAKTYYLNPRGFPVGIALPDKDLFRKSIESDTIQLTEGDLLILYTDGVTEAMNSKRELFGEERLLKIIRDYGTLRAKPFVEKLKEEIYSFTEGQPQNDDITFVVIGEKTTAEKEELRRAKEAHALIMSGKSIREGCETAGITTYAYYNKYKKKFEEEGVETLEIDESVSVEAKHLSIEEKTKIYDIIREHPEYGAKRISEELNTEKYGFTEIPENRVYDELVRSRLNTRQLREAFIARSGGQRRRIKPPGTPLLTLDGRIILREEEAPPPILPKSVEEPRARPRPEEPPREEVRPPKEEVPSIGDMASMDESFFLAPIEDMLEKRLPVPEETESERPAMPELPEPEEEEGGEVALEEDEGTMAAFSVDELLASSEQPTEEISEAGEEPSFETADQETGLQSEVQGDGLSFEENEGIVAEETTRPMDTGEIGEDQGEVIEDEISSSIARDLLVEEIAEEQSEEPVVEPPVESNETSVDEDAAFVDLMQWIDEAGHKPAAIAEKNEEQPIEEERATRPPLEQAADADSLPPAAPTDKSMPETEEEISLEKLFAPIAKETKEATEGADKLKEAPKTDWVQNVLKSKLAERILKKGLRLYRNRSYEGAVALFQRIIEAYPDFKEAHRALGNAYFRQRMYPEALAAYRRVKELDPHDAEAYENVGVIYANTGEYERAIEEWESLLHLMPHREDIRAKIAKVQQALAKRNRSH